MGLKLEWVAFDDGSGAFANAGGLRLIAGKGGRWSVVALGNVDVSDSADNITAAQEAAEAAAARLLAEDAGVRALVSLIGDALTDAPADEPMRGLVDFIAVHVERDALRAKVAELEASLRWIPVAEGLPDEDTQVQLAMPDRGISLGHLSRTVISGVDVWSLPRVRRVDIDDVTHWRPLGAGPEVGR